MCQSLRYSYLIICGCVHANTHKSLEHDLIHLPFTLPKLLHVMMLKTALIRPGMMRSNLWCN